MKKKEDNGTSNVSKIEKTSNNKIVDASPSLLDYVSKLPKYSCETSYAVSANQAVLKKQAVCEGDEQYR